MLITSKDNSKIKEARKLLEKKYSNDKKLFLIEGENLVLESLKNNLLVELFVLDGYECNIDFPYINVSLDVMKTLSDLKSTPRLIGISRYNLKNDLNDYIQKLIKCIFPEKCVLSVYSNQDSLDFE